MDYQSQAILLSLKPAPENTQLHQLHLSSYPKYFFNYRFNMTLIYDGNQLHCIGKQSYKLLQLQQKYTIIQLSYNPQRNIVLFLTVEGMLLLYHGNSKTQVILRKDVKKWLYFDWVYQVLNVFHFFVADEGGLKLFRVDEDKKLKEVKSLSGKFNAVLYHSMDEIFVVFPHGDCKSLMVYNFVAEKAKNWFKCSSVPFDFDHDGHLVMMAKKNKNLGLEGSRNNQEIFLKPKNQDYFPKLVKIHKTLYLIIYFANEGKLRLYSVFSSEQKAAEQQLNIKLPSDSVPCFNVVDNMLVIHLKNQRITFIYDINGNTIQPLVSPFPLKCCNNQTISLYQSQFVNKRVVHPQGHILKWSVQLKAIHFYLKNEVQIFQFLNKRKYHKMQMLRWLRTDLFKFRQLNLSKFWKILFHQYHLQLQNPLNNIQSISLNDLYSNIFYTLSCQQLICKQKLMWIILQCIRQAHEYQLGIPSKLQNLLFELLLLNRRYELLAYLSHSEIIKDELDYIDRLRKEGDTREEELLYTMAVDIGARILNHTSMLTLLMSMQRIRDAKRYIKINYEHIPVLYLIEVAKEIKSVGNQRQYIKFIRFFIMQKFHAISSSYLDQAENKLYDTSTKTETETETSAMHQNIQQQKDPSSQVIQPPSDKPYEIQKEETLIVEPQFDNDSPNKRE